MICKDYDVCGKCFESRKVNKNHNLSHPVLPLPFPTCDQSFRKVLKMIDSCGLQEVQDQSKRIKVIHTSVMCDICKLHPIKGIRFKCDDCYDYDLCYFCWKSKITNQKHKLNHQMLAIISNQNVKIQFSEIANLQFIGKGCFGSAYKCTHPKISVPLVCKELQIRGADTKQNQTKHRTFINQLKAYREVYCNHTVRFFGFNQEEVKVVLYSEYMPNGSLEDILFKKTQTLSLRRKFQIALDVLRGLRVLHRKGIIHKDIKPDNIFLDQFMMAKIGDCGVMLHTQKRTKAEYVTDKMAPIFRIPSPLQLQNPTPAIDMFQFGLLLNEIYTEKPMFLFIVPQKSEYFSEIIKKLQSPNPSDRPTSCQLLQQFQRFNEQFWNYIESTCSKFTYIQLPTEKKNIKFREFYNKWK